MTDLASLFSGSERGHGVLFASGESKTWDRAAVPEDYRRHIEGRRGLGIVPIRADGTCRFGVIDVDGFKEGQLTHAGLAREVEDHGFPLVVCRSRSGDAHLFLFLEDAVPAKTVRGVLARFAGDLGYTSAEIFPKQDQVDAKGIGNWINLPYFGGNESGRKAILADGRELTLTEFEEYASRRSVSSSDVTDWLDDPTAPVTTGTPSTNGHAAPLGARRGPIAPAVSPYGELPCEPLMWAGAAPGYRNLVAYKLSRHLKRKGLPEQHSETLLQSWNAGLSEPLTAEDVSGIVQRVFEKVAGLGCEEPPIVEHYCQGDICPIFRKKEHQTDDIRQVLDDATAKLDVSRLVQVDTTPPLYRLTLNGQEIDLELDDLANFTNFKRKVIASLRFVPTLPRVKGRVKGEVWDEMVNGWLSSAILVAAPEIASEHGRVKALVLEWLTNSRTGEEKECLLRGQRWSDGEATYFQIEHLRKYLQGRLDKMPEQTKLYSWLREMGCDDPKNVRIGTRVVKAWRVASDKLEQDGEEIVAVAPTVLQGLLQNTSPT